MVLKCYLVLIKKLIDALIKKIIKNLTNSHSFVLGSTITGSTSGENDQNLGNFSNRKLSSADSYGSLASSYLPQTRTSSLLKSHQDELFSNRKSFAGTRTSRYVLIWIKVHSMFGLQVKNFIYPISANSSSLE